MSALNGSPALGASQRSFTLQTDPWFGVQATVSGVVRIDDECICFKVDAFKVKTRAEVPYQLTISTVALGIAFQENPRQWNIFANSTPQFVAAKIPVDGTATISPMEFRINRNGPLPEKWWVVLTFAYPFEGTDIFAYAFAQERRDR